MSPRTARTLGLALLLGIVTDAVLTWLPPRLDVASLVALTVAAVAALAWWETGDLPDAAPVLLGGGIAGVAALVWRDSPVLFMLNLLAVGGCLLAGSPAADAARLRVGGVTDWLREGARAAAETVAGALPAMATEVRWGDLPLSGRSRRLGSVGVGLLAALPVVLVFGGLFASADPVFANAVDGLFAWDVEAFVEHGAAIAAGAWLAAGLLRSLVAAPGRVPVTVGGSGRVGSVEVGTALGAVAALFAAFVAAQVPYLFGGAAHVARLAGLSYAEYARRGFFELVWVAALTLPVLLVADWALDKRDPRSVRRVRAIAWIMLGLLSVILASALSRMALYTGAYGLTELRLYTTAFMGWLVAVFGWFGATVLRGARQRFASGALIAAGCVVAALDIGNPDAVIARVNLDRAGRGAALDTAYAVGLSADAVPAVLARAARLPTGERCAIVAGLASRWMPAADPAADVPWTIARLQARRSTEAALPALARSCPAIGGG
jgi:hypothetical protein